MGCQEVDPQPCPQTTEGRFHYEAVATGTAELQPVSHWVSGRASRKDGLEATRELAIARIGGGRRRGGGRSLPHGLRRGEGEGQGGGGMQARLPRGWRGLGQWGLQRQLWAR